MIQQPFAHGTSLVHRLDPRPRLLAAFAFSVLVAVSTRVEVAWAGVAVGVAAVGLARLRVRNLLKRLVEVNVFILFLWCVVPFTHPGRAIWTAGPLTATNEGVRYALAVTLKANGIVLVLTALVATVDVARLGHALYHLRVPAKLIHLFTFTIRYFDVLHREYRRLRNAMRLRCFRPRTNRHTYRTYGFLVGMLLVRSLDRSHRVVAAMKCRGFRGRFFVLWHFALGRRDAVFAVVSVLVLCGLGWLQWHRTTF